MPHRLSGHCYVQISAWLSCHAEGHRVGPGSRAVFMVVILMDVYEMTKGRYQMGKGASATALRCAAVPHGIKTVDSLAQRAKQNLTPTYEVSNVRLLPRA
jgi:hypothetical protein